MLLEQLTFLEPTFNVKDCFEKKNNRLTEFDTTGLSPFTKSASMCEMPSMLYLICKKIQVDASLEMDTFSLFLPFLKTQMEELNILI